MALSFIAASAAGGWAAMNGENDDRWRGERSRFVVADASGPTYGGYHAPLAIDDAIDAILAAPDVGSGLAAAHALLRRRAAAGSERLAHFTTSVAAVFVDGARATVAQIGACRIYRRRGGAIELVARDHCLPAPHEVVVTQLVGGHELAIEARDIELAPGDQLVLVSDGAWRAGEDFVRRLCDERTLDAVLAQAASERRDSATAIVVTIA